MPFQRLVLRESILLDGIPDTTGDDVIPTGFLASLDGAYYRYVFPNGKMLLRSFHSHNNHI
jgi:hypothetical protein